VATIKTSTDIFGAESKSVSDQSGRQILSIKKTPDIFGNETTSITSDQNPDIINYILELLREAEH
jgi:hypothetical protein